MRYDYHQIGAVGSNLRQRGLCNWTPADVPVYTRLGLGDPGRHRADCRGLRADPAGHKIGGEGMSIRMVCVKAPKMLGGLLKLLAGKNTLADILIAWSAYCKCDGTDGC